jgi:DinB family protein
MITGMIGRPGPGEYAQFYQGYVALAPEPDILPALEGQPAELRRHMGAFSPALEQHRYAPGKWSVREVMGHILDAERVFAFRAFCFSRGERNPLPSFDENEYVATAGFDRCSLVELVDEFEALRGASLRGLRRLDDEAWQRTGTASGNPVSVRALGYIMVGHARHHLNMLDTRYRPR